MLVVVVDLLFAIYVFRFALPILSYWFELLFYCCVVFAFSFEGEVDVCVLLVFPVACFLFASLRYLCFVVVVLSVVICLLFLSCVC